MYDMTDEWDRYMLRYDGYSADTLDGFVEQNIATYDRVADTYTITSPGPHGTATTFTVTNSFADAPRSSHHPDPAVLASTAVREEPAGR